MKRRPWKEWVFGGPNKDGRNLAIPCVYALRGPGNLTKIGLSKEPIWRIRKHRGSCKSPLELISLMRHNRAAELEVSLHHYYRDQGKQASIEEVQALGWVEDDPHYREWFWLTNEDLKLLRRKSTGEVDSCG